MENKYKIKLQAGDYCLRDMGEDKYREVAQRFFDDGCHKKETVGNFKGFDLFGWDSSSDNLSGFRHANNPAVYGNQRRKFTYDQIMELAEPEPQGEWGGEVLPPVGTECEVYNEALNRPEWEKCKILFLGKFRIVYESESCHERVANISDHPVLKFRPLKTERERSIEAAMDVFKKNDCLVMKEYQKAMADWLYDAGLLKLPEGK